MLTEEKVMCKIIYFDEGSMSDYVQILSNGSMERTVELLENSKEKENSEGKISAKAGIGGKLFEAILGLNINGGVEGKSEFSVTQNQIAKYIIKNTMLTDFLDMLKEIEKTDPDSASVGDIVKFQDYHLETEENMLSYYVADFFQQSINGLLSKEDSPIESVSKKLKYAKGYFEFIGKSKTFDKRVIMRFNMNCFRNGYTICDLPYMDLIIYAIKVGKVRLNDLKKETHSGLDKIGENISDMDTVGDEELLDMYDILLAGVEAAVRGEKHGI